MRILVLCLMLVGCNGDDFLPSGANYQAVTVETFLDSDGTEWNNDDFTCSGNLIYTRDASGQAIGNPIVGSGGNDIICDPSIIVDIVVTKV